MIYPETIKHLELIEAVIERMAKNSFQLKGWTMTLVVAIGALATQGSDQRYIVMAVIPIIGFWLLDAYYVLQERRYKLLYKNVANRQEQTDFNMDTRKVIGDIIEMKRLCFFRCMLSVSVVWFYLSILGAIVTLIFVLKMI